MSSQILQSGDEKTAEWSPDPTEEDIGGSSKNDVRKSTIVMVDSEQKWDFNMNTVLWIETSSLGPIYMEKTSHPDMAIRFIQKEIKQKIIAVIVLGPQDTLLSEEIQEVIRVAREKQIKTILLLTDIPQDFDIGAFKQKFQSPCPTIIQIRETSVTLCGFGKELRTAFSL